jgi:curved DNA-binding protein CbpA
MPDYFALLQQPRRPWLDPDAVKQKFLALSSAIHPDRLHGASDVERETATQRFAELNAAWQCLREPKDRLGHLLELELGARPKDAQNVSAATMDLFFETGRLCREADAFLETKARTTSPLVKAQMFGQGAQLTDRLVGLQQLALQHQAELLADLKVLDAAWERPGPRPLEELERLYRLLSYVARSLGQIQERIVQLSF